MALLLSLYALLVGPFQRWRPTFLYAFAAGGRCPPPPAPAPPLPWPARRPGPPAARTPHPVPPPPPLPPATPVSGFLIPLTNE